jgi:hypothetical protein
LDRKVSPLQDSINDKRNYYKNLGRRDMYNLYDRNMNDIDLKSNARLTNMDSIYIPRISTGYGLGNSYYGSKRYV